MGRSVSGHAPRALREVHSLPPSDTASPHGARGRRESDPSWGQRPGGGGWAGESGQDHAALRAGVAGMEEGGAVGFDQGDEGEGWRRVGHDPAQTLTDPGTDLERRQA